MSLRKKDVFFLIIIGLLIYAAGFYGYQRFEMQHMQKEIFHDSTIVEMKNGKPIEKKLDENIPFFDKIAEQDTYPHPVTNNRWENGENTFLYLGNRLIEIPDFEYTYEGLDDYLYLDSVEENHAVIDIFKSMIHFIPENVINAYIKNGGTFVFCNEKSMFEYYKTIYDDEKTAWDNFYDENYSIDGFFYSKDGEYKICLRNDIDSVIRSTIHEVGHFVDRYKKNGKYLSETEEFSTIYEEEAAQSEFSEYVINNKNEYFAESFQQMLVDPTFKERCPKTCEYIGKYCENI